LNGFHDGGIYHGMSWKVINGDSLIEVPRLLSRGLDARRVAIVTDNPYGMDNDADYSRFTGGLKESNTFEPIAGDDKPFDPQPWLSFPYVTLWGYQFLAPRLPLGSVLVWSKKRESQMGEFLSDCELGWEKGGHGVYQFSHIWHGFDRESERGETLHPNQKPVALMRWCIERQNIPKDFTIVDPYCGSGPTLQAAHLLGYDCIGIDIDAHNCTTSEARLKRASGEWAEIPKLNRRQIDTPLLDALTAGT
jgi:site-specific DNA-methyltransferase (adenine-specific)